MHRFTPQLLFVIIVAFCGVLAQPPDFDQLPPDSSVASMSTVTTEAEQESRKQDINKRYQDEYRQFIEKQECIIKNVENDARNVKIIFIIAWLLPAIGALINFINKKAIRIMVSILVGLGVFFSNFGSMVYPTDERGFLATASGGRKIVNSFKYKYKLCLDSEDYFLNKEVRNEFNTQLAAVEDAILAEIGKVRRENKNNTGTGDKTSIEGSRYTLTPQVFAGTQSSYLPLFGGCVSQMDTTKALVLVKTEELVYKGKRFSLRGLNDQIPIDRERLVFAGIGADTGYALSKEKAVAALKENLQSMVQNGLNTEGKGKDSILVRSIIKQCSAIMLESGVPVYESFFREDEYIYVIIQSIPASRIEKILARIAFDEGLVAKSVSLKRDKLVTQQFLYPQVMGPRIEVPEVIGRDVAIMHTVSFRTKSDNVNWYVFSIHIEAAPEVLRMIKKVTYTLHPSFKNPLVTVDTRAEKFKYSWVGWGVFRMNAVVYFNDGTEKRIDHQLTF